MVLVIVTKNVYEYYTARNFSDPERIRAQWLKGADLGAIDGLVSVASLMLVVKVTVISSLSGLIAGTLSMDIGEYVSVYSQVDIELAQMKRERWYAVDGEGREKKERLPSPLQEAGASALAFGIGAIVSLLASAFIKRRWKRVGVVTVVSTIALAVFGWITVKFGGSSVEKLMVCVVIGGWAAMLVSFGVLKLFVDIELAQMKRERRYAGDEMSAEKEQVKKEKLPSPLQEAGARALAFGIGVAVLLLASTFIKQRWTKVGVVIGVSTIALALFGWIAAKFGGSSVGKSMVCVVIGGWGAMPVTFGVLKLFGMPSNWTYLNRCC
ncbi:Vacuolar iron transporter-like protein 4 [Nymphaea thermarum]|nr:Vacuolar iron transporter-like protein 4 [Nymphaea thermarum]